MKKKEFENSLPFSSKYWKERNKINDTPIILLTSKSYNTTMKIKVKFYKQVTPK